MSYTGIGTVPSPKREGVLLCFIRRLSGCESDSLLAAWAVTGRACPRCLWGFRDTHPSRNSLTGCVTSHAALDYRAIWRTPVTPRTRRGSRTHIPFRALRSERSASANSARRAWWESHTARCASAAVAALPLLGGVIFCQTRRACPGTRFPTGYRLCCEL